MKKLYLLFPLLLFVFITCEEEQKKMDRLKKTNDKKNEDGTVKE